MSDSQWDSRLDRLRRSYNAPPATPKDEMWTEIARAVPGLPDRPEPGPTAGDHPRRSWSRGWVTTVLSMAAMLLLWLGFGLGRATVPGADGPAVASATDRMPADEMPSGDEANPLPTLTATGPTGTRAPESAFGFAAVRLLASSGTLLGRVENQAASGTLEADAGTWARGLLTQTRLMLDSPAVSEGGMRGLLEDLELILMQVVTVSEAQEAGDGEVGDFELEQLTNGLRTGDVLPRIQRMLPPQLATDL